MRRQEGQPHRLTTPEGDTEIVRVTFAPVAGHQARVRRVLPGALVQDGDLAKKPPRGCWTEQIIDG